MNTLLRRWRGFHIQKVDGDRFCLQSVAGLSSTGLPAQSYTTLCTHPTEGTEPLSNVERVNALNIHSTSLSLRQSGAVRCAVNAYR